MDCRMFSPGIWWTGTPRAKVAVAAAGRAPAQGGWCAKPATLETAVNVLW
jgi:hypothetical protein